MQDVCNIKQLIENYSDMILRIAYQHTGNMHDAEDIAQEVFLSIMKKDMKGFSKEHEKSYIIRTTINKCKSLHRRGVLRSDNRGFPQRNVQGHKNLCHLYV